MLTLLHSEQPKLYRVLAVLSAVGLKFSMLYNLNPLDGMLTCMRTSLILESVYRHYGCFTDFFTPETVRRNKSTCKIGMINIIHINQSSLLQIRGRDLDLVRKGGGRRW